MNYTIKQTSPSYELRQNIRQGFCDYAIEQTGMYGLIEAPSFFEIREGDTYIGSVSLQLFWGQMQVKDLFIDENYRRKGYATKLMNHAMEYARSRGCKFIMLETMSYQAPKFYKKLGFTLEFIRKGFANGTSIYYFKKDL